MEHRSRELLPEQIKEYQTTLIQAYKQTALPQNFHDFSDEYNLIALLKIMDQGPNAELK